MNCRERTIRAIERAGPDRAPIMHDVLPGAWKRYGTAMGDILGKYPADVTGVGSSTYGEYGPEIDVPSRDPWGCLWVRHTDEHKGQVVFHPLSSFGEMDAFDPPDTAGDEIIAAVAGRIEENAGRKYTFADGGTLWQQMYYLHGFAAIHEDLLLEPDCCARLRDMILEVLLRRLRRLGELDGLDGVHFRDDWGTQQSLAISPRLWREFFKPAYRTMFETVRRLGQHVWFHSDGVIDEIIPDLIELGADVLNPQSNCMPRERLRSLVAGRVCLLGDIDRQWTLPFGTPEDVRAAVRADVDDYACFNGGLISRGEFAGDVPLENAEAMLDEMTRHVSGSGCPAGLSRPLKERL